MTFLGVVIFILPNLYYIDFLPGVSNAAASIPFSCLLTSSSSAASCCFLASNLLPVLFLLEDVLGPRSTTVNISILPFALLVNSFHVVIFLLWLFFLTNTFTGLQVWLSRWLLCSLVTMLKLAVTHCALFLLGVVVISGTVIELLPGLL